tara:strand:- start:2062 stop:2307 length:246 start_codon:yes stop_codon:yes gene_type:complete
MAPPKSQSDDDSNKTSVSSARCLFMRNLIKQREDERLFLKAARAGIRASSELTPLPDLKPDPSINFKLLIDNNPKLKSRFY